MMNSSRLSHAAKHTRPDKFYVRKKTSRVEARGFGGAWNNTTMSLPAKARRATSAGHRGVWRGSSCQTCAKMLARSARMGIEGLRYTSFLNEARHQKRDEASIRRELENVIAAPDCSHGEFVTSRRTYDNRDDAGAADELIFEARLGARGRAGCLDR